MSRPRAELGVFGGSGFYSFLDDVVHVPVHTPYGSPSAPLAVGTVEGRSVAFLPRHGVQRIVGPCAAGSLQPDVRPGDFVVLDQLVDRTSGRADTYFDGGVVGHVSFADPYCSDVRAALLSAGRSTGVTMHDGGTVVVVQGPRFSTRAESRWFRSAGWEVVNMTQYPEAYLARELGMCYAGLALVTDYDTGLEGVDGIEPVTMEVVFEVLRQNVENTRALLAAALPGMAVDKATCGCASALAGGPLAT